MAYKTAYKSMTPTEEQNYDGRPCLSASASSLGHMLAPDDSDNPMAWPLPRKLYTSAVAFGFAFVVLYGTTTITAATSAIPAAYGVSTNVSHLAFTMPFFGVFFAPIFTPHVTERIGRRPIYFACIPLFSLCVVVIGIASNIGTLLAFRFLAGLFGGPCLVLIEGTFADLWSARTTVTYYSFLAMAQYWGAAFGKSSQLRSKPWLTIAGSVVGGFVFTDEGPAWLAWVTLFFATIALAFGAGMPETYGRELLRTRIRYQRRNVRLPCALSGVTIAEMAHITIFTPLKMLMTEPLVIMISLCLGLNFALVFQWFISVPAALGMAYNFNVEQSGLAFLGAVGGTVFAVASCVLIEAVVLRFTKMQTTDIENRLVSAMLGTLLNIGSLIWVGFTANPQTHYLVPIFGTAVYVWGNAMVLISLISYLFDAYQPAGTLSALTAAACFRIACAGVLPIFITDILGALGGLWTFSMFAIITAFVGLAPFVLYATGRRLRTRSKYGNGLSTVMMELEERERRDSHEGNDV